MTTVIYVKPVMWAGRLEVYLGTEPSRPSADPCSRLGRYFLKARSLDSARAVARAEAERLGVPWVECPIYVGLEVSRD